ncbi:uncharacterized protein AB675_8456 [Cyphellophora attinorum]|uniref:Uncharacterized protein n=1 Tax=Cyphellophora attinorum TaxID=1664694 RepID=A0A0N1P3Y6_9EURO|nr:uncharacterized protein AB675_8456 [Phialophora attinorum]KPI44740.1 hypothetical protein AB675_8456 [Phialophora attinorum]
MAAGIIVPLRRPSRSLQEQQDLTSAVISQSESQLTSLPFEIRLQIWEHLFSSDTYVGTNVLSLAALARDPLLSPLFACKQMFKEIGAIIPSSIFIGLRRTPYTGYSFPKLHELGAYTLLLPEDLRGSRKLCLSTYPSAGVGHCNSTVPDLSRFISQFKDLRVLKWVPQLGSGWPNPRLMCIKGRSHFQHIKYKCWHKILTGVDEDDPGVPVPQNPKKICDALSLILREPAMHWPMHKFGLLREVAGTLQGASQSHMCQYLVELRLPVGDYKSPPPRLNLAYGDLDNWMVLTADVSTFEFELNYLGQTWQIDCRKYGSRKFLNILQNRFALRYI